LLAATLARRVLQTTVDSLHRSTVVYFLAQKLDLTQVKVMVQFDAEAVLRRHVAIPQTRDCRYNIKLCNHSIQGQCHSVDEICGILFLSS
jgi:hypothetical protein